MTVFQSVLRCAHGSYSYEELQGAENASHAQQETCRHLYGLPEEVKVGKYNASDYNLIDSNLSTLFSKELKLKDQKDAVIKELFKHSDEELHLEKVNVLGSFLGRGLLYLWSHT